VVKQRIYKACITQGKFFSSRNFGIGKLLLCDRIAPLPNFPFLLTVEIWLFSHVFHKYGLTIDDIRSRYCIVGSKLFPVHYYSISAQTLVVKWLWFMSSLYCRPGMTPKLLGWVAATRAITKCYLQKQQCHECVLQWSILRTPFFHISFTSK
jgi:hypothetical protein